MATTLNGFWFYCHIWEDTSGKLMTEHLTNKIEIWVMISLLRLSNISTSPWLVITVKSNQMTQNGLGDRAGRRLDGTVLLCSRAAPDTKPWGHCYHNTAKRNHTSWVLGIFLKKWPSSSLRGPFLGHGADANVGQKEPLLSIKKEQRTGWSNSRGRRGCLLRWKIAPAAFHSPSPRTEGIKSSTDERSGVKLQWGNLIRLLLVRLIWANRRE